MHRNNPSSATSTATLLPSASGIAMELSSNNLFDLMTDPSLELVEDAVANESEAPEKSGKFAIYADSIEALDDLDIDPDPEEQAVEIEEWELGATNWASDGDLTLTRTAELDALLADELEEIEEVAANEVEVTESLVLLQDAGEEEITSFETEPHPSDLCPASTQEPHDEVIEELHDEDVAVMLETTVSLDDKDLEVLEVRAPAARSMQEPPVVLATHRSVPAQGDKVLVRVRAGETLPPNMVPVDDELPRFTLGRKAVRGAASGQSQSVAFSLPASPLPQFGLTAAQSTRPRLPPVILPRFPITDTSPAIFPRRPPLPPVRWPHSFRTAAMHPYATHCTCHYCQQAMALLAATGRPYR